MLYSAAASNLNVSAQIFFLPSTVSTQLTFLTGFIVFKRFFLQRQTHLHQFSGTVQLKTDRQQPQKCHRWLRALPRSDSFDNALIARLEEIKINLAKYAF